MLNPGSDLVKAQLDLNCSEINGAIKAISSFLNGVFQGLEGGVADPGSQKVLNALTQSLIILQREYSNNCP